MRNQKTKSITYRFYVLVFVTLFGIFLSVPSFFSINGPKINLGLDLQGGLHMLLGVDRKSTRLNSSHAQ